MEDPNLTYKALCCRLSTTILSPSGHKKVEDIAEDGDGRRDVEGPPEQVSDLQVAGRHQDHTDQGAKAFA